MILVFSPQAQADLLGIVDYIAERNPLAASRVASRVFEIATRLAAGEFDGPELVLRSGERVRRWPVPPLRLFYQRTSDELIVLRAYHHAREPLEPRD